MSYTHPLGLYPPIPTYSLIIPRERERPLPQVVPFPFPYRRERYYWEWSGLGNGSRREEFQNLGICWPRCVCPGRCSLRRTGGRNPLVPLVPEPRIRSDLS